MAGATRDPRLDYAKGVAIALVLSSHLMPLSVTGASPGAGLLYWAIWLWQHYATTLGVPVFYMTSLILFFRHPRPARRLRRTASLFAFWVSVQYCVWILVNKTAPPRDLGVLSRGGPSLVGADATVFFFLFDLFVLLALATVLHLVGRKYPPLSILVAWVLVAIPLASFIVYALDGQIIPLWSVWNFLPFLGLAYLYDAQDLASRPSWRLVTRGLLGVSAAAFILEAALHARGLIAYANYARPYVVAAGLMLFDTLVRHEGPVASLGEKFGRISLGLYATHTLVQFGLLEFLDPIVLTATNWEIHVTAHIQLLTLVLSLVVVQLLRRSPLKHMVS